MGHRVVAFGRPAQTYASGRVCAAPSCSTRLSIYNPLGYCALHHSQRFRRAATAPAASPIGSDPGAALVERRDLRSEDGSETLLSREHRIATDTHSHVIPACRRKRPPGSTRD